MSKKTSIDARRISYAFTAVLLVIFTGLWVYYYNVSWVYGIGISLILTAVGFLGEERPLLLARTYTNRKIVLGIVIAFCLLVSIYLFKRFPIPKDLLATSSKDDIFAMLEMLTIGLLIGVLARIMLLNLIASMLRTTNPISAKVYVYISFGVFLLLFPMRDNQNWLSCVYVFGNGFGFFLHYLTRPRERKKKVYTRFKSRILNAARKEDLSHTEALALDMFVKRNWKDLDDFIHDNPRTELIDLMELSMLHSSGKYEKALDKIADIEKKPDQYEMNHFHYLHRALNESEKFDHKKDWRNLDVIRASLQKAVKINPNCMMTNANLALYKVYESRNRSTISEAEALNLIWKAIKEYENNEDGSLRSLITGVAVPVTYAYLLDIYAYILLKSGKSRFARHFLFQCLYLDPNQSSTYLHLAEYYCILREKKKDKTKYRLWTNSANMCLYISQILEKRKRNTSGGSLVYNKAEQLLESLNSPKE